jgi:hypothetical protein
VLHNYCQHVCQNCISEGTEEKTGDDRHAFHQGSWEMQNGESKHSEHIAELKTSDTNSIIGKYRNKWAEHIVACRLKARISERASTARQRIVNIRF